MGTTSVAKQTFTYQDGPVTIDHAIANADADGRYLGTIRIDQSDFFHALGGDIDDFYDWLTDRVIGGSTPIGPDYTVVAVDADGYFIVEVTQYVLDVIDDVNTPDFDSISTATLVSAVERYADRVGFNLSDAQAEITRRSGL